MKILHLAKSDSDGGAAKAGSRIHKGLQDLGVDSQMWVDPHTMSSRLAQKADRALTLLSPKTTQGFRSAGMFGVSPRAAIQKFNPDILQLHWINRGFLRLESLLNETRPIVWRFADLWPISGTEHYPESLTRLHHGYLSQNNPSGTDGVDFDRYVWERKKRVYTSWKKFAVVAPTSWMAEVASKSPLLKNRRIEVISTGQDLLTFFEETDRKTVRQALGIDPDGWVVGFGAQGGVRDPRKGFSFLIKALKEFSSAKKTLLLFGSDLSIEEQTRIADESGCAVVSLGVLQSSDSLRRAYSSMDAFFVPSIFENLANTAIEAMACGTPAVSFKVGGMPDLIEHERSGFLAGQPSIRGLVDALQWIESSNLAEHRLAARARVHSKFTIQKQAESFKKLYENLLLEKS